MHWCIWDAPHSRVTITQVDTAGADDAQFRDIISGQDVCVLVVELWATNRGALKRYSHCIAMDPHHEWSTEGQAENIQRRMGTMDNAAGHQVCIHRDLAPYVTS